MFKKVEHLIVDTSGFLKKENLQEIGSNIYTVQNVVDEITSKSQIRKLVVLPYDLQIIEPSSESIKFITEFSKKTGDYHCLSATDIRVMALTYQMEIQKVGYGNLKSEPKQNKTVNFTKKPTENPRDIVGFYFPSKKDAPSQKGYNQSSLISPPVLCVIDDYLGDKSYLKDYAGSALDLAVFNLLESSGYPQKTVEEAASSLDDHLDLEFPHLGRWMRHIKCIYGEISTSSEHVSDEDATNFIQHLITKYYDAEVEINMLADNIEEVDLNKEEGELGDDDGFCEDEDFNEEYSADEDDDDEGWITPDNIKDAVKDMGGETYEEKEVLVGCLTTDFAMQNVLKQVGLSVVSLEGRAIKELRTHVLRCHACFHITNNPAGISLKPGTRSELQGASIVLGAGLKYQFCPKCGYQGTLRKVAVTVNEDGEQVVNVSCRKPITGHGKRFSVPRPKGGKHSNDPIICADQRVPQRHPSRLAKMKTDAFNPDYIAGFSPFVMRDITSRAAMFGIQGNDVKHWLRRNPNEKKYGRRRKK